ncbi:beta-glucosidase [Wenyingzhuangia heitensis]|uniref:beta-glucosidase n=1 Tax=Wenyingzhuangia heitensis TaxID=1487859 RepID=A0ABX0UDX1_9FLAO|nr:glycoside hydrolase family 3 N-terminal domain-containing protein [Wenyingzhuangia heitensis]NIJ46539.1 beta-glucosidase [Wenyingzhuangia heitensis]
MKNISILIAFLTLGVLSAQEKSIEQRIDSVMSLMTLQEKIGQMNQVNGRSAITGPNTYEPEFEKIIKKGMLGSVLNASGVDYTRTLQKLAVEETRLGIPLLFGYDVIHGWKTIFPIPLAESASWDLEAIEKGARIAAIEASAAGQHWTFAPMVDIARDSRWGRIMEGAGEDPYLGSKIAAARVHGFQGNDLSANNTIAACAKHFAAYGAAEGGRDYNTVDVSERTLRDIYLPPFKAALDAGVQTFMSGFNEISGVPATGNKFLLDQILRKEWGFDGFVVSDANSVAEMINHGFTENEYEATKLAVNAGCDMDMSSLSYYNELKKAIHAGDVPMVKVNNSVRRILRVKFKLGLFDDPFKYCDNKREKEMILSKEHKDIARDAARKSFVLLKNEKQILPLNKEIKKIAVIGPLADSKRDMIAGWKAKGEPKDVITLLDGLKNSVARKSEVLYAKGCEIEGDNKSKFGKAIEIAKKSDVIVLAIGEGFGMSAENRNRADINIPGVQVELAKELSKLNKPIVVVLFNGRPLTMPWISENVPSILEAWFPGVQAGNALADVIFGNYNPSGKLPVSFPIHVGQTPMYYNYKNTGRPIREDSFNWQTKYLDVPNRPYYPFGFGLSYTTFQYSDLILSKKGVGFDEEFEVRVKLKNTGKYDGSEVAQLYVRDLFGSVTRPVKELKGFEKVFLKAGEEKVVTFKLISDDFRFHNIDMDFVAEPGEFKVFVGGNSNNVIETDFFLVK